LCDGSSLVSELHGDRSDHDWFAVVGVEHVEGRVDVSVGRTDDDAALDFA
jgi:hypothetical protein